MPERIPQSTTLRVTLRAYLSTDHLSPATGKTIAITISKNGAAFGNPSAGATNATEIANGWYYVDMSTTDTGTVGPLILYGTAAGVDTVETAFDVASVTAVSYGVNAVNIGGTAQTGRDIGASVLLSAGTGAGQLDFTSGVVKGNVTQWLGSTVNALISGRVDSSIGAVASGVIAAASFAANALDAVWSTTTRTLTAFGFTVAHVTLVDTVTNLTNAAGAGDFTATMKTSLNAATVSANVIDSGTAQAGGSSSVTLKSGSSAVSGFYDNAGILLTGGTGAGQFNSINTYVGSTKVATVGSAWATMPDATTTYQLLAVGGGSGGSSDPATIAAAVWNSLTASYTTAGTFGALLTSIYNKLSTAVNTFISPVAVNMDTTIYADRDFNNADGLALEYPTNITVGSSDTITWNGGPQGNPYVTATGFYVSDNLVGVNITAVQGASFPNNVNNPTVTEFEVVVTRNGNGRKIQAVTGKLTIDGVIVA